MVYIDKKLEIPVIKEYEVEEGEMIADAIFKRLSSPPSGVLSYVPKGLLRAAYLIENAVVLDLYSTPTMNLSFYEERLMIYQILFTIFRNFNVDKVYIVVDGGEKDVLGKYTDVSFGFLRKDWESWPVKGERSW